MCMEDIRLGREIAIVEHKIRVNNAQKMIVDESMDRVFLMFYPPVGCVLTLSTLSPVVSLAGLSIGNTAVGVLTASHPLMIDVRTHGQLCFKRWFGITDGGSETVSIFEGLLLKK